MQDVGQRLILLEISGAGGGAVREHPTDTGPADYVLFVKRIAVGVIEAKRDEAGENLIAHEAQTARYANATLKWRQDPTPLPFLFESTGQIIRFTDGRDPAPRAREVFHFFKPESLEQWLGQRTTAFTPEQTDWLRLMKDHIAASCCITRSDFEFGTLARQGGLQTGWRVFGSQLDGLMGEMNEALVA